MKIEQSLTDYIEKREYFSLIERVGSWNQYQFYLFFLLSTISIIEASLVFIPPYLFHTASYQCSSTISNQCTNFVCSLPQAERASYTSQSPFRSLSDDLGFDFRCQYSSLPTLFSTLVYVSTISGMLLFSIFTQKFGRKNSLILATNLMLIGLALTLLSGHYQSIVMVIFSIMILYWGATNSYQYIYCFAVEVVAEQKRLLYMNLLDVSYGFGIMLNAFTFYYIKQWMTIYIFVFGIPTIIVILSIIFFVEKTPIDLLDSQNEEEIQSSLKRIAQFNKLQFLITFQQIKQLKGEYLLRADNTSFTPIDLFKYQSLRNIILPLVMLNFATIYLFYAPSVIGSGMPIDLFHQGIISGVSFITSIIVLYLLISRNNRRHVLYFMNALTLLFGLLIRFQSNQKSTLYLVYYFAFRFLTSLNINCVYIINYQVFPTQIRAVGANFVYLFGSIAGVVQPSIVQFLQSNKIHVTNQFILIVVLSFVPIVFLKETFKVPPPEIIEQLAKQTTKKRQSCANEDQ